MSSGDDYVISKFGNFASQNDAIYGKGGFLEQLRDNQMEISLLKAQVAKLTRPEMTRELPSYKGFYWRRIGPSTEPCVVFVSRQQGFWVYEIPGCPEPIGIWPSDEVFWSATPIPVDPMPKEEL